MGDNDNFIRFLGENDASQGKSNFFLTGNQAYDEGVRTGQLKIQTELMLKAQHRETQQVAINARATYALANQLERVAEQLDRQQRVAEARVEIADMEANSRANYKIDSDSDGEELRKLSPLKLEKELDDARARRNLVLEALAAAELPASSSHIAARCEAHVSTIESILFPMQEAGRLKKEKAFQAKSMKAQKVFDEVGDAINDAIKTLKKRGVHEIVLYLLFDVKDKKRHSRRNLCFAPPITEERLHTVFSKLPDLAEALQEATLCINADDLTGKLNRSKEALLRLQSSTARIPDPVNQLVFVLTKHQRILKGFVQLRAMGVDDLQKAQDPESVVQTSSFLLGLVQSGDRRAFLSWGVQIVEYLLQSVAARREWALQYDQPLQSTETPEAPKLRTFDESTIIGAPSPSKGDARTFLVVLRDASQLLESLACSTKLRDCLSNVRLLTAKQELEIEKAVLKVKVAASNPRRLIIETQCGATVDSTRCLLVAIAPTIRAQKEHKKIFQKLFYTLTCIFIVSFVFDSMPSVLLFKAWLVAIVGGRLQNLYQAQYRDSSIREKATEIRNSAEKLLAKLPASFPMK